MFADDRTYLENKYHDTSKPFNPFERMAYHGYAFDETTGLDDEGVKKGLAELEKQLSALPHPVAKAKAVGYVLQNTRIDVNEHDYFVALYSLNRLAGAVTQNKWSSEVFSTLSDTNSTMCKMCGSGAAVIWPDFDHVVPDWDAVLNLGFPGLLKRCEQYRKNREENGLLDKKTAAFFDGMILTYQAILALIDRLYRYAKTKAHEKAEKITACLLHIRDGAPQNTYEAMQVIFLYFLISECFDAYQVRSLGNGLDSTLWRFYQNDIKTGVYTKEEIKEYFRYFLMQWSAIGNYWGQPFYMGGTNKDGSTKYNELSELILDVYDELDIYNPKIQIKVNHNTPDSILFKVFDMIRRGHSSLVFCCEPGMIRAVMSYGATYDEAREMDIRGCYETGVRAAEVSTATAYVNAAKPVEYVFSNGYDKILGETFGVQTGKLSNMEKFEDFYAAVLAQWSHLIELSIKVSTSYDPYLGRINPSNMYSATIQTALEKGADAYQNGVKFNNSALLNCGFATLVDSVMAVKEFVYDKKEVTLEELKTALDSNWKGYEALHAKVLNSVHKYGCNDPETNVYAEALASYFAMKVNNRPNGRGGVYKAIMHSARMFIEEGKKTGATPDGRFAGTECSKNASPSVGMDKNGVTALIESAVALRPYTYPESFCLDIMLHPSAVSGDEGLGVMKALLFTYMQHGGMSIQFNVFNTDTLRDAQKHPENYKNLQVRVCGWNVLWNNMCTDEQNAYIKRSESIQ